MSHRGTWDRMRFHEASAAAIKAARQESGLTQRALAELAGISHTEMTSIEDGHKACSLYNASRLAEALDTTIDALAPVLIDEKEDV